MQPQNALSPKNRLASGSLKVLYISPDGWSLAEMVCDGHPAVGLRWDGDRNNPDDKGNPASHRQGTWFILPDILGVFLAGLVKGLREGSLGRAEETTRGLARLTTDYGRTALSSGKIAVRAGWAEACRELAESGDDALVWPEFGNADDAEPGRGVVGRTRPDGRERNPEDPPLPDPFSSGDGVYLRTVIVAPMTTGESCRFFPSACYFPG